jgi:hypothetical protein
MSEEQYDITLTLPTIKEEQSTAGFGPEDSLYTHTKILAFQKQLVALGNN